MSKSHNEELKAHAGDHKQHNHGSQHTAEFVHEKMERRYDAEGGQHDKDHHDYRENEKSHPHTQHGGDPVGHKHPEQTHENRHEHDEHKHHKVKEHDHKESSRLHHKTA